MNLWNAIIIGVKEIQSHAFRSLLTMLGIILGVSSLVAMSALVKGMEMGMRDALIAIGGLEKVRIEEQDIPTKLAHLADQATGITMNDVIALKRSAPLVRVVTPEMRLGRATFSHGNNTFNPFVFVGTWPNALEMNQHVVEHGRMFTDIDDEYAQSVCVIGTLVRDELFGSPEKLGYEYNPVGERVTVNGQPLTIIGMFQHYESEQDRKARLLKLDQQQQTGPTRSRGWANKRGSSYVYRMKNATVYIPLNTMWIKFRAASGTNNTPDPRLSQVNIKIASIDLLEPALQQARNVLLQTHHGVEDFSFQTQENWEEQISSSIKNARMSGGIIAAISLLVGGIGIMNIMLASITERVRELGIRKAVGASNPTVFIQINVESVLIAVVGGIAGLAASYVLVQVLAALTPSENTPIITVDAMLIAFAFSVLVGILAGLIPAFKAARLNPIQALRYE